MLKKKTKKKKSIMNPGLGSCGHDDQSPLLKYQLEKIEEPEYLLAHVLLECKYIMAN